MQSIKQNLESLNQLVLEGKSLEAFDKFYHPDVTMQENEGSSTVGKAANRKREEEFYANIIDFRGAKILGMAVGDNISYVTWQYDFTHKDWGVRNYTQVSVQYWKDGLIIKEQFFYGN